MNFALVGQVVLAAFVADNLLLSRCLGFPTYLGVYRKPEGTRGSLRAAALVAVLMVAASAVAWPLDRLFLEPHGIGYLRPLLFVLALSILAHLLDTAARLAFPGLRAVLREHGPFALVNCAVLGAALMLTQALPSFAGPGLDYGPALLYSLASAVAYWLTLGLIDNIRERVELAGVPRSLAGLPIVLLISGLIGLVLMGVR